MEVIKKHKRDLLLATQSMIGLLGLDSFYARNNNLHGAIILMYHSVKNSARTLYIDPANNITEQQFIKQMDFLKNNRNVISLDKLVDLISAKEEIPVGTVVLTFDDGYVDNFEVVAPILQIHDLPATLFLPTGYIDRQENQWIDHLYWMFMNRTNNNLSLFEINFNLQIKKNFLIAYEKCSKELLSANHAERNDLLMRIYDLLSPEGEKISHTLNWAQIKEFSQKYPSWSFGCHTHNHIDLTTLSPIEQQVEISQCVSNFCNNMNYTPAFFSYPYNRVNDSAKKIIKEIGFKAALSTGKECLISLNADLYQLPRIEAKGEYYRYKYITSGAHPSLSSKLLGRS